MGASRLENIQNENEINVFKEFLSPLVANKLKYKKIKSVEEKLQSYFNKRALKNIVFLFERMC